MEKSTNIEWTYKVSKDEIILFRGTLIVRLEPCELYPISKIIQNASFDWCKLTGLALDAKECRSNVMEKK